MAHIVDKGRVFRRRDRHACPLGVNLGSRPQPFEVIPAEPRFADPRAWSAERCPAPSGQLLDPGLGRCRRTHLRRRWAVGHAKVTAGAGTAACRRHARSCAEGAAAIQESVGALGPARCAQGPGRALPWRDSGEDGGCDELTSWWLNRDRFPGAASGCLPPRQRPKPLRADRQPRPKLQRIPSLRAGCGRSSGGSHRQPT
jgi:hypothetical protein